MRKPLSVLLLMSALPLALNAWGRAWVSHEAAAWGALVGAMLPSVGLAAFAFGQLAQLAGMTLALFTLDSASWETRNHQPVDPQAARPGDTPPTKSPAAEKRRLRSL